MAANRKTIHIGIADMHTGPREATALWLDARPGLKVVLQAGSEAVLQYKLENKKADVLLLELSLPEGTAPQDKEKEVISPVLPGKESLRMLSRLVEQYESMKIIVYSVHGHRRFIGRAMYRGASSYLCKTYCLEELETTICCVAEQGYYYTPEISKAIHNKLIRNHNLDKRTGPFADFSAEEIQCLRHWIKGLSVKETSDRMNRGEDAVKGYRKALYKKTGCRNVPELIQWAIDNGLEKE